MNPSQTADNPQAGPPNKRPQIGRRELFAP